jgi:predicted transcriptional regulator
MARTQMFTAQQVADACRGSGGIQAVVANTLGCTRATISVYAKRYKTVRNALDQAEEELTDLAESKHVKLIQGEYWPAIQYRLSTKGKRRGYTEKTEVENTEAVKLVVRYENPPVVEAKPNAAA